MSICSECHAADVMVVVDGSASVTSSEFNQMKQFVTDIVQRTGPSVRIGVVEFGDSAQLIAPLSLISVTGQSIILNKINSMIKLGGGTNIGNVNSFIHNI